MVIDFTNFTASDYAAWWGAVTATLALLWNIIVAMRSGARIKIRATPNMIIYPKQAITEDNTYISVTAVNHGNSPTTITHFCGFYAPTLWALIRGKKKQFVINTHSALGKPIPFVLAPGEEWGGLADQKNMLGENGDGYLYLGIIHNQRTRPMYKRVKLNA